MIAPSLVSPALSHPCGRIAPVPSTAGTCHGPDTATSRVAGSRCCSCGTDRYASEITPGSETARASSSANAAGFDLAQTEGSAIPPARIPTRDADQALATLDIAEIPFEMLDGNCLGCARDRSIAINPVNPMPHKTRFHELAHVLLGHTAEGVQADGEITPRNLSECEAEAVALLCCAALELPGVDQCRGYIQAWWGSGNPFPERSAQRVLKAADQILRAGRDAGATNREGV
jgi:hypothetical protein